MGKCRQGACAVVMLAMLGGVEACATTRSTEFTLPKPVGLVTDLASVLPDSAERALEATLRLVRALTEGEIAVVTLATLPGVTPQQMAQRIGTEWGVGARTGRARDAGAVVLLIPRESSSDGRGYCRIELATAANAFIADSTAAHLCEAALPFYRAREYAKGLDVIVSGLARLYIEALGSPKLRLTISRMGSMVRPARTFGIADGERFWWRWRTAPWSGSRCHG